MNRNSFKKVDVLKKILKKDNSETKNTNTNQFCGKQNKMEKEHSEKGKSENGNSEK